MNASRPAQTALDRAYVRCRGKLLMDTHIDPIEFAAWLRANRFSLRDEFHESGEPTSHDPDVEDCLGIWLRKRYLAQRYAEFERINPASVPVSPATPTPELSSTRSSSERPAGIFRWFRRSQVKS